MIIRYISFLCNLQNNRWKICTMSVVGMEWTRKPIQNVAVSLRTIFILARLGAAAVFVIHRSINQSIDVSTVEPRRFGPISHSMIIVSLFRRTLILYGRINANLPNAQPQYSTRTCVCSSIVCVTFNCKINQLECEHGMVLKQQSSTHSSQPVKVQLPTRAAELIATKILFYFFPFLRNVSAMVDVHSVGWTRRDRIQQLAGAKWDISWVPFMIVSWRCAPS